MRARARCIPSHHQHHQQPGVLRHVKTGQNSQKDIGVFGKSEDLTPKGKEPTSLTKKIKNKFGATPPALPAGRLSPSPRPGGASRPGPLMAYCWPAGWRSRSCGPAVHPFRVCRFLAVSLAFVDYSLQICKRMCLHNTRFNC